MMQEFRHEDERKARWVILSGKRDKMAWQFEIQLQIMLALHEHTKY